MRTTTIAFLTTIGLAGVVPTTVVASGGDAICTASQKQSAEGALKKAEDAERAGRTKEAHAIVDQSIPYVDCAQSAYKRRDGLIERTGKKLGAEAEKAGQYGDAYRYFSAPHRHGRADYPLADADRAMLKHAKARSDDFKIVQEAASYFARRDLGASQKEIAVLAKNGGNKMLAREEKAFAATTKDSLKELDEARRWFEIGGGAAKPAHERAEKRGDALLAESTVRSLELALRYYHFAGNKNKEKNAHEHARKLGDEHSRKGEHKLAVRYYELAGDDAKARGLAKKAEAEGAKAEAKRQDKFKKDQKSLEKELGL